MPIPHSKYSYSALEVEAHELADRLHKQDGSDDEWSDIESARDLLRQLANRLNYARSIADLALFALAEENKPKGIRETEAKDLRQEFNLKVMAD